MLIHQLILALSTSVECVENVRNLAHPNQYRMGNQLGRTLGTLPQTIMESTNGMSMQTLAMSFGLGMPQIALIVFECAPSQNHQGLCMILFDFLSGTCDFSIGFGSNLMISWAMGKAKTQMSFGNPRHT